MPSRRVGLLLAALLLAALLGVAACAAPSSPLPSDGVDAAQSGISSQPCYESSELREPDGERLDLTGTWQNSTEFGSLVFVAQVGNCVSWAGGFPSSQEMADLVQSPWGQITVVFQGTVGSDYFVRGTWAEVRHGPEAGGPLPREAQEWKIEFIDNNAAELTSTFTSEEGTTEEWMLRKISDEFLEPLNPASRSTELIVASDVTSS